MQAAVGKAAGSGRAVAGLAAVAGGRRSRAARRAGRSDRDAEQAESLPKPAEGVPGSERAAQSPATGGLTLQQPRQHVSLPVPAPSLPRALPSS